MFTIINSLVKEKTSLVIMTIVIQPRHVSFIFQIWLFSHMKSQPSIPSRYPLYIHITLTLSHHNSNIFKLFYLPLLKLSLSLSLSLSLTLCQSQKFTLKLCPIRLKMNTDFLLVRKWGDFKTVGEPAFI